MTTDGLVTLAQIEAARALIGHAVHRTPLLSSATAARVVEVATGVRPGDGRVYLKAEHLPDLAVVVCGIGGGGLISGVAAAIREQRPQVRVYGVEPTGSDAMSRALEAGQPVPLAPRSVADGLNAPFAGERTLAMVRR